MNIYNLNERLKLLEKDFFASITDYRKLVLLTFLIKNDKDFLLEIVFSERDINHLNLEFKNILLEQHEEYLGYVKNQEESIIEKILNKKIEAAFSTLFEDVRHERSFNIIIIIKRSRYIETKQIY